MTLRQQQSLFAKLLAKLILWAYAQDYEVTLGASWRAPELVKLYAAQGRGSKNSVHPLKLAQDLNLFIGGRYMAGTAAHRPLGEYWKSLHPLCRWGGDFRRRDGNHYSMARGRRA